MTPQYTYDSNGNPIGVFIPINGWNSITERYSDIEDVLDEWYKYNLCVVFLSRKPLFESLSLRIYISKPALCAGFVVRSKSRLYNARNRKILHNAISQRDLHHSFLDHYTTNC